MLLFFDTETTGLPENYNSSIKDINNWPKIIELAWITTDKNLKIIKKNSYIVNVGFDIDYIVSDITNITNDMIRKGKDIKFVLEEFSKDLKETRTIISHNINFDRKIIGSEFIRNNFDINLFRNIEWFCTMVNSTNILKLHSPYAPASYKWPKLEQLYYYFFNEKIANAHRALADVEATIKCYSKLKDICFS